MQDSIRFVLANFIEMNKLWVRMQHQGHSRQLANREMDRRELRLLVGTNLTRLSQLLEPTAHSVQLYQHVILPALVEQIINCADIISQSYLMDIIIQVFPDEFHLASLRQLLPAINQLELNVQIRPILCALIGRLCQFVECNRDE